MHGRCHISTLGALIVQPCAGDAYSFFALAFFRICGGVQPRQPLLLTRQHSAEARRGLPICAARSESKAQAERST